VLGVCARMCICREVAVTPSPVGVMCFIDVSLAQIKEDDNARTLA
jgi:hypothetical protein